MSARGAARRLGAIAASLGVRRRHEHAPAATLEALLELASHGSTPLVSRRADEHGSLEIAAVIPSFRRGSGGHATAVHLLRGLRARGHSVSVWLEDSDARHEREPAKLTKRSFADFYEADGLELHTDFDAWRGADVVLATGWQTVPRALLLPGAGARAYLVQDHEPDFYGASAEAVWAEQTYRKGLHCIAASPWLAGLLRSRYAASATHFDLAVDHTLYRPTHEPRRGDLVVFYARAVTPRRAVPLGLLALSELARRRPDVEIALYGDADPVAAAFEHRRLGLLDHTELAALYRQATVGVVLSLTNPSLIGLEMMASGLPCVELASESMLATFGSHSPLQLAQPDPLALCAAIEAMLDDPQGRELVSRRGIELVSKRTWSRAAEQLQEGLRTAVARRAQD